MRTANLAITAMRFCKPIGRFFGAFLKVVTRCTECGATHRTSLRVGTRRDAGTMLHQPWCSMDLRNIRHNVTVMRR